MSHHTVNNLPSFDHIALALLVDDKTPGHRHLMCVDLCATTSHPSITQTTADPTDICFVPAAAQADRTDRITQLLGQEHRIIIHELSDPMDAGILAALTGTLIAGGVMLLIMPSAIRSAPSATSNSPSRFGQRFRSLLSDFENAYPTNVHHLTVGGFELGVGDMAASLRNAVDLADSHQGDRTNSNSTFSSSSEPATELQHVNTWQQNAALEQQNKLLSEACDFLANTTHGCVTVTGKRGRGKSTLLARIADWLNVQGITFAVTAANRSALNSFNQHIQTPAAADLNPTGIKQTLAPVLLVDEAGNLPVHVLLKLLSTHDRVVFCTTVEGYESAGRAFDVRFVEHIKSSNTPWLALTPTQPWRWAANDPLEQLINELVINNSDSAQQPDQPIEHEREDIDTTHTTVEEVTQQQLANDPHLLRSTFNLLRQTHYQSTVQDLQHLLDGDDIRLWVLRLDEQADIAGVIIVSLEGGIDSTLHDAVVDKQRRLPHQLLPQLLAQMANSAAALSKRYARVIRVCIDATLRQQGLGSRLLNTVELQLTKDPTNYIQALGASFATDTISLAFWDANGFTEFHRGFRLNPRTGRHAVAVIKSYDDSIQHVIEQAAWIHHDNERWRHHCSGSDTLAPIAQANAIAQPLDNLVIDNIVLRQFSRAQRSAHDSYAALSRLAARQLIDLPVTATHSQKTHDIELRLQVARYLEASDQCLRS